MKMISISDELRTWWTEHLLPSFDKLTKESVGPEYKRNSWSPYCIAVLPEHRHKGIAKAMIETVETTTAQNGSPLVLEVNDETNIIIYKQLGFKLLNHSLQVKGGATGDFTMYVTMKETAV